jgi:hypothetical protein
MIEKFPDYGRLQTPLPNVLWLPTKMKDLELLKASTEINEALKNMNEEKDGNNFRVNWDNAFWIPCGGGSGGCAKPGGGPNDLPSLREYPSHGKF